MQKLDELVPTLLRGSLMEHSDGSWSWIAHILGYDARAGADIIVRQHYSTNADKCGLWLNDRQIRGTGQFSLSPRRDTARRQIKRYFARFAVL